MFLIKKDGNFKVEISDNLGTDYIQKLKYFQYSQLALKNNSKEIYILEIYTAGIQENSVLQFFF